jgi:2-succinyl-5-enolpyruvyl-6-hydroxy-3-cyclohexene-1-carboxylate synthase
VQRASAKSTLAIVGDLSALYDLNALALLRQASAPFVLIVVNNNGGQIFSCCRRRRASASASI